MPSAPQVVISVGNVSKTYDTRQGGRVVAIGSVSLEVRKGEFVSILGRSGCGKSTLLKIVSGFIPPTSGTIEVLGRGVTGPVRGLGQVFQRPTLMPWRNVLDNVLLPAELLHEDVGSYRRRALQLLEMVGLKGFERLFPSELSLGMRHRVSLARALVHEPEILIMDEPFGSLDELTREEMAMEMLNITERLGKTVLFVTHSIPEAVMLGDRVVVLSSRPSQVVADFEVGLPRPRTIAVLADPKLVAYSNKIRALLGLGVPASSSH